MKYCKELLCCLLFVCFCSNRLAAQLSYQWFKGWWKYDTIHPDKIKNKIIESDLEITEINNNTFAGFQKTICSNDTAAQVKTFCSGWFTNGEIHYRNGNEMYRKEPPDAFIWNVYTQYAVDTSYFSIRNQKLILHIKTKPLQNNGVKEFAYYRDLLPLDFSVRWQLEKRYGTPQLIDDSVPVVNNKDSFIDTSSNSSLPANIITRKNTLIKTLTVTSPDIQIVLLDDAEIDGDIVSLYHNNELVINHKTLGKEMIKYTLKADKEHPNHEFVLVAENLGSIPPNTALVRIRAGDEKFEFIAHSDLNENVKFVINYVGNNKIDVTAPPK